MKPEQKGRENYKTHKFFEFILKAKDRTLAEQEAEKMLQMLQKALEDTYRLHVTLRLIPGEENNMEDVYTYACQVFAQSIRSEQKVHKHMRVKEAHELDMFGLGVKTGLGW